MQAWQDISLMLTPFNFFAGKTTRCNIVPYHSLLVYDNESIHPILSLSHFQDSCIDNPAIGANRMKLMISCLVILSCVLCIFANNNVLEERAKPKVG